MKELVLDLQGIELDGGETWADSNARGQIENALLDYAGKIVRVKITINKNYRQSLKLSRSGGLSD